MKVLAVNSSPRKKSLTKTRLMLENLVQGMRDAGAEVDVVDIHDKTIEYCTACFACFNKKFNETELCIHKDDMTADLLPKWKAANLVVYASPVFFHSVTAKLKTFFERTLPVYVSFNSGDADGPCNPAGEAVHPSRVVLAVSGRPADTAVDDSGSRAPSWCAISRSRKRRWRASASRCTTMPRSLLRSPTPTRRCCRAIAP